VDSLDLDTDPCRGRESGTGPVEDNCWIKMKQLVLIVTNVSVTDISSCIIIFRQEDYSCSCYSAFSD